MIFRRSSPDALTVRGLAPASSTTSEHVASKPRPLTAEGGRAASAMAARTEAAHAAQISDDDCSTTLPVIKLAASDARNRTTEAISSTSPIRAIGVPPIQASYICGLFLTNALRGVVT